MSVTININQLDTEVRNVGTFSDPHATLLVGARVRLTAQINDDDGRRSLVVEGDDELTGPELEELRGLLQKISARLAGAYQGVINGAGVSPATASESSPPSK